jgi:hypothetical protein
MQCACVPLKALTDHLEGGSRVYSFNPTGKLEARIFFLSFFKGPSSQDQQKSFKRRLITFKVTLTGQSHFMLTLYHECTRSYQLRTMNVCSFLTP